MNIYLSTTTAFNNNGLGFLTDILSASVTEELNGQYQLSFTYPINGSLSEYLVEENIVKCRVADGSYQLFRINQVKKNFNTIEITAFHIFYDLLNNFLEDTYPQNLNGQLFLKHILDHTVFANSFEAQSDIAKIESARYVRKNPVEAIMGNADNSMLKLFGGEIKRDNFKIKILSRVGSDNGVKLLFGKNITGIDVSVDITNMATRIMPQGYDGLLLPEKYVDSLLINTYPTPKIKKIEFSDVKYDPEDESAYHSLQEAYEELRRLANEQYSLGVDKPSINIKVDWIELSKTNEYKNYSNLEKVNLGDTITSYLFGMNFETRVTKIVYNPLTDVIEKYEIGTPKASISTSMNNIKREVESIDTASILNEAKEDATNLIATAMGGYIYKTQSELYIMDTNDPTTAQKVWRWNINGLGYSSTGVNGPYGIAMTMDGQIVADFITTGKLDTSVIEGYDSLLLKISEIADLTREVISNKYIELNDAILGDLISLRITGEISILPSKYMFPSDDLFPHDAFYLKVTNEEIDEESGEISLKSTRYKLPFYALHEYGDVKDEFIIDSGKVKLIKRIGVDKDDNKYLLTQPIEQTFDDIVINLKDGYNRFELVDFPSATLSIKYAMQSEYSKVFATKAELDSSITLTKDEINMEVEKKVDENEIISTINQSAEEIKIKANKIGLEGYTTINKGFSVDEEGNASMNNATMTGGNITIYDTSNDDANIKFVDKDNSNMYSSIASHRVLLNSEINNINIYNSDDCNWIDLNNNQGNKYIYIENVDTHNYISLYDDSNDAFLSIDSTGSGDGNPYFHVQKGSYFSSMSQNGVWSPSFNNNSLKEVKKNIKKLTTDAVKLIASTDLYKYNYKDESNKDKKHIGIVIGDGYNYPEEILSSDGKGVDLYSMISVCFKAIQEQQVQIQELKNEINKLKEGDK